VQVNDLHFIVSGDVLCGPGDTPIVALEPKGGSESRGGSNSHRGARFKGNSLSKDKTMKNTKSVYENGSNSSAGSFAAPASFIQKGAPREASFDGGASVGQSLGAIF
jgi:hypothetical protein